MCSALEARAGNFGHSAIAWSSYGVAMVSISSYEIFSESFVPIFQAKSTNRSLRVNQSINSDNYEYAISLVSNICL